ncbi:unnamed protein product [Ostreobium quekettii]|uniref:Uncharacterized protein n=1 Tax=Ostreobium quekettii TaxID=121088 RepID=A0A8S1J655_9CHLO|nr:unnamed protein product [Ostreobium quekettii]
MIDMLDSFLAACNLMLHKPQALCCLPIWSYAQLRSLYSNQIIYLVGGSPLGVPTHQCYSLTPKPAVSAKATMVCGSSVCSIDARLSALVLPSPCRYSNLVLVDGAGIISACAHQVGKKMSSVRQLQVGGAYGPPPQQSGIAPTRSVAMEDWREIIKRTASELLGQSSDCSQAVGPAIIRAFQGVSPSLAEDLLARAGIDMSHPVKEVSDANWEAMYREWQTWTEAIANLQFVPTWEKETGRYSLLGSYSSKYTFADELLDEFYLQFLSGEEHAQLQQQLSSVIARQLKKANGKVKTLRTMAEGTAEADGTQKKADIIMANLHSAGAKMGPPNWRLKTGTLARQWS